MWSNISNELVGYITIPPFRLLFTKWVFPKIMVPPNHPFLHRVFHHFHHPFWGKNHYFWKHPNCVFVGFHFNKTGLSGSAKTQGFFAQATIFDVIISGSMLNFRGRSCVFLGGMGGFSIPTGMSCWYLVKWIMSPLYKYRLSTSPKQVISYTPTYGHDRY